jgi:pimeloyl-ACP methyl ester carboxylesterase
VLAVDRPGHGLADPFDYRRVDLFEHAHTFLEELLNAEGLSKLEIAGNSMGGLVSLAFALRRPERIEHLWLVGVPAGLKRRLPLPARLPALPLLGGIVRRMIRNPTRQRTRRLWGRILVKYPDRLSDEFLDVEVAMTRRHALSIISLLDRFIEPGGVAPDLVMGSRWEAIRVPTTFVIGDHDRTATAREVEAVVARNPLFNLVKLVDVGHVPWVDSPKWLRASAGSAKRDQDRRVFSGPAHFLMARVFCTSLSAVAAKSFCLNCGSLMAFLNAASAFANSEFFL